MEKEYNAQEALQPGGGVMQEPAEQQPTEGSAPLEPASAPQGEKAQEMLSEADQAYIGGLMKMLHSKETAPLVEEMLQAGEPGDTIPRIANQINDQMEQAVKKKPALETALAAGIYLVQDLIEIGRAAGYFDVTEDQMQPIFRDTMQIYIEAGLNDGSIDPIELQEKVEPLMDEQQKATGLQAAELTGVPKQATEQTAMAAYGAKRERQGMMRGKK